MHFVQDHEAPLPATDLANHEFPCSRATAAVADHAIGGDHNAGLAAGRESVLSATGEHVHLLLLSELIVITLQLALKLIHFTKRNINTALQ